MSNVPENAELKKIIIQKIKEASEGKFSGFASTVAGPNDELRAHISRVIKAQKKARKIRRGVVKNIGTQSGNTGMSGNLRNIIMQNIKAAQEGKFDNFSSTSGQKGGFIDQLDEYISKMVNMHKKAQNITNRVIAQIDKQTA